MFLLTSAIALWASGLLVIDTLVATTAFGSGYVTRTEAGLLVGETLRRFNRVELVCAVVALSCWFSLKERFGSAYRNRRTILSTLLAMTVLSCVTTFVLTPRIQALRNEIASFEGPDPDPLPPNRLEFRRYHGTYVVLSLANVVLGFSVLFVVSRHAVRSLNALEEKSAAARRTASEGAARAR